MRLLALSAIAATASATELLLPLYQYPANNGGAWSTVESALKANPSLTAKIVINPDNGPGGPNEGLNDPQYVAGGKALSAIGNAQLLGYVHTSTDFGVTRCNRNWNDVVADIRTWSTWVDAGIAIRGIFIDEAPVNTANDCVNYMQNLTNFIRSTDQGLKFGASPSIIFNPGGTGTLQAYYAMNPTYIIALETCFTVPAKVNATYDECPSGGYEVYDHNGVGSSLDNVVFPNIGKTNAAHTAVLVHGFHDFNGPSANLSATADVLQQLVNAVVQRGVGATFFNTAGYHNFSDGPASIGAVASLLTAANAAHA